MALTTIFLAFQKSERAKRQTAGEGGSARRGQIMTDRLEAKKEKNLNSPQLQEQCHPLFEGNLEGSNMGYENTDLTISAAGEMRPGGKRRKGGGFLSLR